MTTLDLSGLGRSKVGVKATFRGGWLRHIGVAVGGASGAAVVLGGYEVLRAQPDKAFALLQAWGPWFLVVLVVIFVLGKFLDGLSQAVRESFSGVVSGLSESASASSRTADALTKLAEQGGRQIEETQRLAIYAAREFPAVYDRFDVVEGQLKEIKNLILGRHQRKDGGDER